MSELDLHQLQIGTEVTWGTPVAPTVKLMAMESYSHTPHVESKLIPERRASLQPGYLAHLSKVSGECDIEGACTYDDFPYFLDGLFGQATPGGAGPYTRAYAIPVATKPVPRKMTLAYGEAVDGVYGLTGGVMKQLTITGEVGEPLKYSAKLVGEQVEVDTLAALSDRTVTPILAQHNFLYIDTWAGTIGTTLISAAHITFELSISTPRDVMFYMGSLRPLSYKEFAKWEDVKLKLTLEFNATVKAYLDEILLASVLHQRQIRLKFSDTANRDLQFDFAGFTPEAPEVWTDEEGIATLELEYQGQYHNTLANSLKVDSINQVAVLP